MNASIASSIRIVRGQTNRARGESRAGQVRIDAQPAVPLHKERFHEPFHNAMIAWPPRHHHDGPAAPVGFIVDRDISEVTLHALLPPCVRIICRTLQDGFAYPSDFDPLD